MRRFGVRPGQFPSMLWWLGGSTTILLGVGAGAIAQTQQTGQQTGLVFEGARLMNAIQVITQQFTGECPGQTTPEIRAWFTSSQTPTGARRRVTIRNVTPGVRPDEQPFSDREYEEGTASEPILIEFGTAHSRRRFRVLEGENQLQYEIKERNTVLESGTIAVRFDNTVQTQVRNSTQQTQQVCANASVPLGTCADVRSRTQWTCPGGSVLRQQFNPPGPTRTVISNQTFVPVSYEVQGRVYFLRPGQEQVFTGNNLGTIRFPDGVSSTPTSQLLTSGTRYRFAVTNNRLQITPWNR